MNENSFSLEKTPDRYDDYWQRLVTHKPFERNYSMQPAIEESIKYNVLVYNKDKFLQSKP